MNKINIFIVALIVFAISSCKKDPNEDNSPTGLYDPINEAIKIYSLNGLSLGSGSYFGNIKNNPSEIIETGLYDTSTIIFSAGKVKSINSGSETETYSYDSYGRLTKISGSYNKVEISYNEKGQVAQTIYSYKESGIVLPSEKTVYSVSGNSVTAQMFNYEQGSWANNPSTAYTMTVGNNGYPSEVTEIYDGGSYQDTSIYIYTYNAKNYLETKIYNSSYYSDTTSFSYIYDNNNNWTTQENNYSESVSRVIKY